MEAISDRIKRMLEVLGLKRTDMAKRLKISDASVSTMCSGKTNPSGQTITMICKEFHISEHWLRTGEGEMFDPTPTSAIDEIVREYDLDDLDKRIIVTYLRLSQSDREAVKRYIHELAEQTIDIADESIEEYAERVKQGIIEEKRAAEKSSAWSGTDGRQNTA